MLARSSFEPYSAFMKSAENRSAVAFDLDPAEPLSDAAREKLERFERARLLAAVEEGLADTAAGRVVSDEQLQRDLDEWFGPLP